MCPYRWWLWQHQGCVRRQRGEACSGRLRAARDYRWLRAAPAALILAGVVAMPAPASAASGPVMPADTVTAVAAVPVSLAVPADGRVDGYGFAGRVLGAATGAALPGPSGLRAGPGQRLWVFGLEWNAATQAEQPNFPGGSLSVDKVQAALVVDGQHIVVPLHQPQPPEDGNQPGVEQSVDSGPQYFVASVPADAANVVVELSGGGYTQDFSLTHMARQGPQPAVLYRDPTGWQVTQPLTDQKTLPTPYDHGGFSLPSAALIIDLNRVTLSYFAPDGPSDPATGLNMAWFTPTLADPVQNGWPSEVIEYLTAVPPSDITLALPNGQTLHPKTFAGGPDPVGGGSSNNGLFPDRYAFEVPATLTTATLTIAVPTEQAVPAYSGSSGIPLNPGTATFPISLPSPGTVAPPADPAHSPALINTSSPAAANTPSARRGQGSSAGPISAGMAALVAITLAAVILTRRRHQPSPATTTAVPGGPSPPAPPAEPPGASTGGRACLWGPASWTPPPPNPNPGNPAPGAPEAGGSDPVTSETNVAPVSAAATPDRGTTDPLPDPTVLAPDPTVLDGAAAALRLDTDQPGSPLSRFVAPVPPLLHDPAVRVLGEVTVTGWADPPNRSAITQLVVFLALHPGRPVSADALLTALAEGDAGRDNWLRSTASRARNALGVGHLPDATLTGGYHLDGVACDWTVFQELTVTAARHEHAGETGRAIDSYSQALALITGRPFVSGDYGWVDSEGLRTHIERAVSTAAQSLARLALDAGQADLALWAARQGHAADPLDETVAAAALGAAAATGRPGAVRAEWTAIIRDLAAHDLTPSPELTAIYHHHRFEKETT